MTGSKRIAFLFNHDQVHQVAHGLPVAMALAREGIGDEILLCSANDRITSELRALGGDLIGHSLKIIELKLSSNSRLIDGLFGGIIPSAKLLLYRDNLDFFRSLDILVVPEKTSLILKDRFGLEELKIVHTRHGAGDRAIGFNKASARFDHVLAAGSKIRDRLIAEAGVAPERISVVGYPKFDLFPPRLPKREQRSGSKVVVYNPHVAPHLSSWYRKGREILGWFADRPDYRLIFAPHIMLFERRLVVTVQPPRIARPGRQPTEFARASNVEIDTGSRALTTMEYLNRADIYLGDASSQVYEFLVEPRPCLFFDAHGVAWENDRNFEHWRAGEVVTNLLQLEQALATSERDHDERYKAVQEELRSITFDFNHKPASVRAAQVIAELANGLRAERRLRRRRRPRSSSAPLLAMGPDAS